MTKELPFIDDRPLEFAATDFGTRMPSKRRKKDNDQSLPLSVLPCRSALMLYATFILHLTPAEALEPSPAPGLEGSAQLRWETPSFTLPTAPGRLTRGPQTATAGRTMRVDWLLEDGTNLVASEAGIWPGKTYSFLGLGKSFDAQTIPAPGKPSPLSTLFVKAHNAGASSDVVGLTSSAVAGANGATVFGANFIARTDPGVRAPKLVALELDVEPAAGVIPSSNSLGLAINAFNSPIPGPAIQLGGVEGGTFNNGIGIGGVAASGAGLFGIAGTRMGSLVNSGAAAYAGNAPIVLSNGHAIQFSGRDGEVGARIVNDDANNLRVIGGTRGVSVRDNADTKTVAAFDPAGNLRLSGSLREEGSAPPSSARAPCIAGQHAWDANYEYRCVARNTWKRAALAAW